MKEKFLEKSLSFDCVIYLFEKQLFITKQNSIPYQFKTGDYLIENWNGEKVILKDLDHWNIYEISLLNEHAKKGFLDNFRVSLKKNNISINQLRKKQESQ